MSNGAQIGQVIGSVIGSYWGPWGQAIGAAIGPVIGERREMAGEVCVQMQELPMETPCYESA